MNSNFHTFVICAYKQSPYLERCIRSLKAQTESSDIICTTSTPSEWLRKLLEKYGIPLYVRQGNSQIGADWNFAISKSNSTFVTIAHQDDLYEKRYTEILRRSFELYPDMTLFCTDAALIRNGKLKYLCLMELVKKILRIPLRNCAWNDREYGKKMALCFGNPIMCPSCAYRSGELKLPLFREDLQFAVDWDCLIRMAEQPGRFVCAEKPLLFYRVHEGAATKACMKDHSREREEAEMFSAFWPKWMVSILMKGYQKAYSNYTKKEKG